MSHTTHSVEFLPCHSFLTDSNSLYFKELSSDLGGILVKLLYLAYIYGHLFKVDCYGVGWSIQVILYAPFLGLRAIWLIMQSLVLAFSALP